MSQISIDLLGAMEISCFPGSRKTRKIYPLIIGDINYKAVSFELLEGASGYDIALGLLTHQAKYSPLTLVISDKGTAMGSNVINLQTSDGLGILDSTIFHAHSVDSQQKNPVERYIQGITKLLRTAFWVKRDSNFPVMTYSQLQYAYEKIFQEYNSVPYLDEGTELAPMDFLKPYNKLNDIKDFVGTSSKIEVINAINGIIKSARTVRWGMIIADGKYDFKLHPSKKTNPSLIRVAKGDICLIKSKVKTQYQKYCLVLQIISATTALIRVGGRETEYAIFNLVPVFRPKPGVEQVKGESTRPVKGVGAHAENVGDPPQ